jgi:hypothetical protein
MRLFMYIMQKLKKLKTPTYIISLKMKSLKVSKLTLNQIKRINSSEQIQNVLTKVSIYEYLNKIKKS